MPDVSEDLPFRAVVRNAAPEGGPAAVDLDDAGWSEEEIELAYQRALEAADLPELEAEDASSAGSDQADPSGLMAWNQPEVPEQPPAVALAPADLPSDLRAPAPQVTQRQIIEALLFVGGRPLTSRAIADVLGGSASTELVEQEIVGLNECYTDQRRPYEVRLVEGGYCLSLRAAYEKVRDRSFGFGPKEVKLSQDALEVLAFVAYRQPVTPEALTETAKPNASSLVRQLIRRELVALKRCADSAEPAYETTPRFLELFGLASVHDLPRAEAISFR